MRCFPFCHPSIVLKCSWLDTKLGPMIAISDDEGLYLLEFVDRRGLEREVERLRLKKKAAIIPGITGPIKSITLELKSYFDSLLTEFKTPLHLLGTPFQKLVWTQLMRILMAKHELMQCKARLLGNLQLTALLLMPMVLIK